MLNLEAGQTATIELDRVALPKWTNQIAQIKLHLPSYRLDQNSSRPRISLKAHTGERESDIPTVESRDRPARYSSLTLSRREPVAPPHPTQPGCHLRVPHPSYLSSRASS
jgi:hypothetical protein